MRVALLHADPWVGAVRRNVRRLESGLKKAADGGAEWIVTPELATSGYSFSGDYGTDWIGTEHDAQLCRIIELAAERDATIFLGVPQRDDQSGALFNSLVVIDRDGGPIGSHRKINTLKVGSEAWSSPGDQATVLPIRDFGLVGLLICADACSLGLATEMKQRGAKAIVSGANWAPGEWGPAGEWEQITTATDLPIFVCNRTGEDALMSFAASESVVAMGGRRLVSYTNAEPHVIFIDWNFPAGRIDRWWTEPF